MIFVIIPLKIAWLMRNQGSQSNWKHAQNISIHTVTLYFTIVASMIHLYKSHVQEIINEGTTCMILIMLLNVWAADFW